MAVGEQLHFGRAAEHLHLSQPALSRQIRQLEARLGVRLLSRTSRRVELTPAGEVLLHGARRSLEQATLALDAARRASRGESGYLRIGFRESAAVAVLPAIVRDYRRHYPDVALILEELDDYEQTTELNEGRLHAGFVRSIPASPRIETELLMVEPYGAILPERHRLAERARIPLSALAGEDFVLWPRSLIDLAYEELIAACRRHGFAPRIAQEAVNSYTIMSLVAAGIGVSLLAYTFRHVHPPGVRVVRIQGLTTSLHLAWQASDTSPLLSRLREIARSTVLAHEPEFAAPHPPR